MTPHMKWGIAGVVIGLILFWISPWLAIAVIAAAMDTKTIPASSGVEFSNIESINAARIDGETF